MFVNVKDDFFTHFSEHLIYSLAALRDHSVKIRFLFTPKAKH